MGQNKKPRYYKLYENKDKREMETREKWETLYYKIQLLQYYMSFDLNNNLWMKAIGSSELEELNEYPLFIFL